MIGSARVSGPGQIVFERLYGRDQEVAALVRQLSDARTRSSGAAILISGEAGVGKTRLVAELRRHALQQGWKLLEGAAVDYASAPYAPFAEAILSDGHAPADVHAALSQPGTDTSLGAQADTLRRFKIVETFLRKRARPDGALLIVEDLQWSDGSTLSLLAHLTRNVRDIPLIVVATYRSPDLETDYARGAGIVRLQRAGAVDMPLGPLLHADMVKAITATVPENLGFSAVKVAAIADLAEGRPFIAEELLRDAVVRARQKGTAPATLRLSLRTSVLQRLAAFDEPQREVILTAAVAGRIFDTLLLSAILGLSHEDVQRTIGRARRAQLVAEDAETGQVSFRHAITREVLYHELMVVEARALHVKIAEYLETRHDGGREDEIAYHLWAARSAKAVAWNERAGQRAAAINAHAEAADFFERALDLTAADGDDYPRLLELSYRALCTAGELERAVVRCREAAEALRKRGLEHKALRLVLQVASQQYEAGSVDAALATMDQMRCDLRGMEPNALHFAADVALATFLALQAREIEALEILESARRLNVPKEPIDLCRAEIARGLASGALGCYDDCLAAHARAYEIAAEIPHVDLSIASLANIASVSAYLGRTGEARDAFEKAIALAKACGHAWDLASVEADLAHATLQEGDLAGASARAATALSFRELSMVGRFTAAAVELRLRSLVLGEGRSRTDKLGELLASAFDHGEPQLIAQIGGAVVEVHLADGDVDTAMRELAETLSRLKTPEFAYGVIDLAAAIGTEDDVRAARHLLERATERGQNAAGRAHLLLFDARCAKRGGDEGRMQDLAEEAAAAFRALPWPLEEAAALEVAGDLKAALQIYRRVGATRLARRAEDSLGIPRSKATKALGAFSRREEQVAELLVRGYGYRAIGEELGIGERTVESHAQSVYQKTGVKTKVELIARLRDRT